MRKILFRGKRTDNKQWVEGFFFMDGAYISSAFIMNKRSRYIVDRESIGQYTGLKDKNGKRIFEGDIVRIRGNQAVEDWKHVGYTALIAFIDGGFCALDGTIEDHGLRRYGLARLDFDLEVIGNIHDNPELLEA